MSFKRWWAWVGGVALLPNCVIHNSIYIISKVARKNTTNYRAKWEINFIKIKKKAHTHTLKVKCCIWENLTIRVCVRNSDKQREAAAMNAHDVTFALLCFIFVSRVYLIFVGEVFPLHRFVWANCSQQCLFHSYQKLQHFHFNRISIAPVFCELHRLLVENANTFPSLIKYNISWMNAEHLESTHTK